MDTPKNQTKQKEKQTSIKNKTQISNKIKIKLNLYQFIIYTNLYNLWIIINKVTLQLINRSIDKVFS